MGACNQYMRKGGSWNTVCQSSDKGNSDDGVEIINDVWEKGTGTDIGDHNTEVPEDIQ